MLKLTFADELEFVLGGTRGGSDSFSKSCPDCTEKNRERLSDSHLCRAEAM